MKATTRKEAIALGLTEYYPTKPCKRGHLGKSWVHGGCNECGSIRGKEIRQTAKHKQRISEYAKTAGAKISSKRNEVKRRYGITLEEYQTLISSNTHCPICRNEFQGTGNLGTAPCLDHCHDTGKVRGAICGNCNRMLGYSKDNIDTLKNAISYLEANPK